MVRTSLALFLAAALAGAAHAQTTEPRPLPERIVHTDPARYRVAKGPHGGAGEMNYASLLGADATDTNFLFLHRGVIPPGSGIGQHFHNDCEEMFVILDGEAQFTIDGRTAVLKGPAGAPTQAGHAHGIFNHSDKPVQWLNINVGMNKVYDAFDLGDPRVGVPIDAIPQFMTLRLDRALLRERQAYRGGSGTVMYRQALAPSVFRTGWSYVDHILIPPGAAIGPEARTDMAEVYYVLGGEGAASLNGRTAPIRAGDAIPIRTGEGVAIQSVGAGPLELMVVGVARDAGAKRAFIQATMPARR